MSSIRNLLFASLALVNLCVGTTGSKVDVSDVGDRKISTDNHIDESYLPEFPSISRSIIGRADAQSTEDLQNNVPATVNSVQPGGRQVYRFPSSILHGPTSTSTPLVPRSADQLEDNDEDHNELRKRQDNDVTYYISLSVCSQPTSSDGSGGPPPQLMMFVSDSNPNADGTGDNPQTPVVDNGYLSFSASTSGDLFMSITAPTKSGYTGSYTYELVVSIDEFYTNYVDNSMMYFVDTDNTNAMFVSEDLTQPVNNNLDNSSIQTWNRIGPQFSVYIMEDGDPSLNGLSHSYCALRNTTRLTTQSTNQTNLLVETGITTISGPALQQQFYVSGLQNGTNYLAAMGLKSNYTTPGPGNRGGGGTLYNQVAFTTKIEGNCQIIYNRTFCPQVNYAVPSNPNRTRENLTQWYENEFQSKYQFFVYALDQIACNTSSDSRYSLAVGCSDCNQSYVDWLCTVTSPRCHDYSSQKPYLHVRNVAQLFINGTNGTLTNDTQFNATYLKMSAFNGSRNTDIDVNIAPGPYKELLPCGDVCNKLVRSCPAALGFGCPYNPQNYNNSYGYEGMDGNLPTCNYPGRIAGVNGAVGVRPSMVVLSISVILLWSLG